MNEATKHWRVTEKLVHGHFHRADISSQTVSSEPGPSTPSPAKRTKVEQAAEPTQPIEGKSKAQGKAAKVKPAPQPGNAEQATLWGEQVPPIGNWWSDLPAKGKEYPGLGYKRVRDKPPKAQQQQQPAVAQ
ncbi:hypothetical protein QJQ45_010726 [Haematococcus lacustris]|nr:hypothetical protein QJQ45_010726 [Haematococcus lacustris]